MTTITQRLRHVANCLVQLEGACEHELAPELRAIAAELEAPAADDAEHAAMYRWLRERGGASWRIYPEGRPKEAVHATGKYYDAAVRAAMKETK